jgi:glycosyltransferase involved in cell wall biosynthesis
MRILVVAPQFPFPLIKGIKIRLFNILSQLHRRHEVELAVMTMPEDPDPCPELEAICKRIHRLPPPRQVWSPDRPTTRLQDLEHIAIKLLSPEPNLVSIHLTPEVRAALAGIPVERVDALFCFRTYLYPVAAAMAGSRPLLVDFDDVEHVKLRDQSRMVPGKLTGYLDRMESRKLARWEHTIARRAAASFVCSAGDRSHFPADLHPRIHLLPNGAHFDRTVTSAAGPPEVPHRLLMLGDMGYLPNADGAVMFCERILPLVRARVPQVEVAIVGNHPEERVRALARIPGVQVTGFVPDVEPWLRSAAVLLVPIRFGGGTRLKILEALRWERAVVSTPAGCAGLEPESGKHLLVAEAVVGLLGDPERRRRLGREGRAWAEATYDWARIGDRLLATVDEVVAARERP